MKSGLTIIHSKEMEVTVKLPMNQINPPTVSQVHWSYQTLIFLGALELPDLDFFPNLQHLLLIGCISPASLTEAKCTTSGKTSLEIIYLSTRGEKHESNFDFLQLYRVTEVNIKETTNIFVKLHLQRFFNENILVF